MRIFESTTPVINAHCSRCGHKMADQTVVLVNYDTTSNDPVHTPFLVGYVCINPKCANVGNLTLSFNEA